MTKSLNKPDGAQGKPGGTQGMSRRQIMVVGASLATAGVAVSVVSSLMNPQRAHTAEKRPRPRSTGRLGPGELTKPGPLPELVLGKEDAPVTIIEYADLTCPACAGFHTKVLPQVKEKYIDSGKAKLVFREFPTNIPSIIAFMTVRCVEPEKAHPLISALFSRQEEWRGSQTMEELRSKLFAFGQQVGLTRQAFDACVPVGGKKEPTATQKKMLADLYSIRDRGHDGFGVNATPTFFVNGKKLPGLSMEDFDRAISQQPNP